MSVVIYLIGTVGSEPTEFDGKYVKVYDPTYVHPEGYDGGILEVTDDPAEALQFPDMAAAIAKYRQTHGWRRDGEWNRPLTMWSVEFETYYPKEQEPAA
jgi:hypothetical protein